MHVLGAVEIWGSARADTVVAENLDSSLLEHLVRDEVEEIVGGIVADGATGGELDLGSGRPNDNGTLLVLGGFELGGVGDEGLGCPVFNQFVDFLDTVSTTVPVSPGVR